MNFSRWIGDGGANSQDHPIREICSRNLASYTWDDLRAKDIFIGFENDCIKPYQMLANEGIV